MSSDISEWFYLRGVLSTEGDELQLKWNPPVQGFTCLGPASSSKCLTHFLTWQSQFFRNALYIELTTPA